MESAEKDSHARARQIGALLSLALLAESCTGRTSCLLEQLHRREFLLDMVDVERSCFRTHAGRGGWSNTLHRHECHDLSRADIIEIINKERFEALTAILALGNHLYLLTVQSSWAICSLSDALQLASPTACLLGAVTSIEILLSNPKEKYDAISQRLSALLGEDAITQYDAESVLNARHSYVHGGKVIEDYNIPMKAICLALSCLLRYAEVAHSFKSKKDLLYYLDFVSAGMRLSSIWNEAEKKVFNEMLKHKQKSHVFLFLSSRLHVPENQGRDRDLNPARGIHSPSG
jgi:hypothetical protein